MPDTFQLSAPRRRWFRFSLRTLLVAMTLLCVWLGFQVNAARRQKEAVAAILMAGGSVLYDYEVFPLAKAPPLTSGFGARGTVLFSGFIPNGNAEPTTPAWLRQSIGDEYFRTVLEVSLPFGEIETTKAALSQIANLPAVKCLLLNVDEPDSKIRDSDLAALTELNQLERLMVRNCRVNGAFLARLRQPSRMLQLALSETDVDDAALEQIGKMTNLENLLLDKTKITDAGLAHLHGLKKLKVLDLRSTVVTAAAENALRHSIPGIYIGR